MLVIAKVDVLKRLYDSCGHLLDPTRLLPFHSKRASYQLEISANLNPKFAIEKYVAKIEQMIAAEMDVTRQETRVESEGD